MILATKDHFYFYLFVDTSKSHEHSQLSPAVAPQNNRGKVSPCAHPRSFTPPSLHQSKSKSPSDDVSTLFSSISSIKIFCLDHSFVKAVTTTNKAFLIPYFSSQFYFNRLYDVNRFRFTSRQPTIAFSFFSCFYRYFVNPVLKASFRAYNTASEEIHIDAELPAHWNGSAGMTEKSGGNTGFFLMLVQGHAHY